MRPAAYLAPAHPFAKEKTAEPGNYEVTPKLKPQKPYHLRRWKFTTATGSAHFFTCARPGRSSRGETKTATVDDNGLHGRLIGLRDYCGSSLAIISLLGKKHGPGGLSEFSFYPFCGGFDTPSERSDVLTFQEWLSFHHGDLGILVREHPTYDLAGRNTFPPGTLDNIKADIEHLISQGYTVVVVDSGGETRTRMVARHIGAKEDSSNKT